MHGRQRELPRERLRPGWQDPHNIDDSHRSCTNSILPGQDCPLVPCACADESGCRGHTPHSKQLQLLKCAMAGHRRRNGVGEGGGGDGVKVEDQTGLSKDPGQFAVFPGLRGISRAIPEIPGHLASMHAANG